MEDFISIHASYQSKSLQIRDLAKSLNLGFEHFVFIDDNPIEIFEVASALPELICIQFPEAVSNYPEFLHKIRSLFSISEVTNEDRLRTDLYRSRELSQNIIFGKERDLSSFLKSLDMRLNINNRSQDNKTRAVQLINKTNQFNMNGIRLTSEEVNRIIEADGKIYSADLLDINGNHGEIIALLLDGNGVIISFVMSCRVFQRKTEYAFLGALLKEGLDKVTFHYKKSDRNEPFRKFVCDLLDTDLSDREEFLFEYKLENLSSFTNLYKITYGEKL